MINALYWGLVVELVGLITFPFLFYLLPNIKDKGYSLSKVLGLLLFSWFLWIAGSIRLLPSSPLTLWLVLCILGVCSMFMAYQNRANIRRFLFLERHAIIFSELVFLLVYLFWINYKFHNPFINTTEQPMDFAIFNAVLRSDFFPPSDPWLSGYSVPYYYFGYLIMANIAELTFVPSFISYNLALSMIAALSATAIFGLSYNLIKLHGSSTRRAVMFSLLAPIILIFIGNMETLFEVIHFRGLGSDWFWQWVGIKDLHATSSMQWSPFESMWWWRATRVIDTLNNFGASLEYTITEFPFFSFILGDLHPHVMSLPFIISFILITLNTYIDPCKIGSRFSILQIFFTALVLGALPFINIWDVAPFLLFWVSVVCLKAYHEGSLVNFRNYSLPNILVLKFILIVLGMSFVMYLPYYFGLDSQASGIMPVGEYGTRVIHLFAIWGFFFVIIIPFLVVLLFGKLGSVPMEVHLNYRNVKDALIWRRWFYFVFFLLCLPIFVWAFSQIFSDLLGDSTNSLSVISSRFLTEMPLLSIFLISVYVLLKQLVVIKDRVTVFVCLIIVLALSFIMWAEFLRVADLYGNRMNTVFKTYYQSWLLLSLGAVFGIYFLTTVTIVNKKIGYIFSLVFTIMLSVSFLIVLYYPLAVYTNKTNDLDAHPTLNGLAHVFIESPGEYAAILWLSRNAEINSVLLEAVGKSWSQFSRISSSTGIPTVLGWPWHEEQWRGQSDIFDVRESDVTTIYMSFDELEVSDLIDFYDINYIVVGPREISKYGEDIIPRIANLGEIVFSQDGFTIYNVSG